MNLPIANIKQQIFECTDPIRKASYPELYASILVATNFLPKTAKIKERIYCIVNDITTVMLCKQCNTVPVIFGGPSSGYKQFCSTKCSACSPEKILKIQQTNILNFGTKTPAESVVGKERFKQTLKTRYGDSITCTQQLPAVRNKTKLSNFNKFGAETFTGSDIGKQRINESFFNLYGSVRYSCTDEYKQQVKIANNIKYNRDHPKQTHISIENLENLNNSSWLIDKHYTELNTQADIANTLGVSICTVSERFKRFNIETLLFNQSDGEKELYQFIKDNYNGEIQLRSRNIISPHELDIYLPALNLAIEYNGVYWHSENNGKDRKYHITKYSKCKELGIRLIQVFDTEWNCKKNIVKSRILNVLQKSNRIYARKCSIIEISNSVSSIFFNDNHIQGNCNSLIQVGLIDSDNTLVACMSFGKSRFNKSIEYELLRYATISNYTVVGGASKIFKFFKDMYNPVSVISYCDLRWGTGKLYTTLGMVECEYTRPSYFYFKPNNVQLMNRQRFQKHKLPKILDFFDTKLTEWDNMKLNGYYRIWDCGHAKFIYTKEII